MDGPKTIITQTVNTYVDDEPNIETTKSGQKPTLIFFITEDWYFCSHRLPLAQAARDAGFDVAVITRVCEHEKAIRQAGIRIIPLELDRGGMNPFTDLATIIKLIRIYKHERPKIIHHVALKPVIYGSIAAKIARVPHVINALTGLGWLFTSQNFKARILSRMIIRILQYLLKSSHVIIQNTSDAELVNNWHIPLSYLIQGAGVDTEIYFQSPEPDGLPQVILPARMLWDKGVGEFVQAARILKNANVAARFILVGNPDPENPSSIPESQLSEWVKQGTIEWWGHRDNMPEIFRSTHIVCLPSYREGLPKVLMEAAASGRPIVTTDVPGCRDIVHNGNNGLLVPPRNPEALAEALGRMISDMELRRFMGGRGRRQAVNEFSEKQVITETLAVYREALG